MAKRTSGRSARKKPNIIIFMIDTQGARNMSCYGYRLPTTPNIDQIAREGVLFERHFVTAPWTLPVHASLFTGRYESGHGAGAQHEVREAEPGLPTMARLFRNNGYHAVALSANGYVGGDGWALGQTQFGKDRDFEFVGKGKWPPPDTFDEESLESQDKGALKLVRVVTRWIEDFGREKPFLIFARNGLPHDAYRPPEPFRSRFLAEGVSYAKADKLRGGQAVSTFGDRCQTLDEWMIERSMYDGCTACIDDRVGRLVAELKRLGVYDDTIFIITGDHGDTQGEQIGHAYHSQNGVWDRACQTPLIVRYPKVFKAGVRCKELVQINDVFPTLMEIAGIRDKAAMESSEGESLLAALKGPTREFALLEAQRAVHVMRRAWCEAADPDSVDVRFANVWYKAARTKRHKYIWASNGQDMLFDVVKDPDERWNIIQQKPEIARRLRKALEKKLMSMEQRYYMDLTNPKNLPRFNPYQMRRMSAWGLYQPGVVPPWDEKQLKEWKKRH